MYASDTENPELMRILLDKLEVVLKYSYSWTNKKVQFKSVTVTRSSFEYAIPNSLSGIYGSVTEIVSNVN